MLEVLQTFLDSMQSLVKVNNGKNQLKMLWVSGISLFN